MDERADGMDDMEFVKLFSSLDSVTASEDLKKSTLEAIFASADTATETTAQGAEPDAKVVKFPRNKRHHGNHGSHTLRIAGIAACFALLSTVGTAYNMPTSFAEVDDGETNLTLGINSLGMTVSAESDSDKGKKLIEDSDVVNKNYRDSVGAVATGIATHTDAPEASITISVSSNDKTQQKSIAKGSSEAVEVSGYKKKTAQVKTTATKKSAEAAAASEEAAKTDGEETNENTFEVNTADAKQKAQTADSTNQADKYHPLSDDTEKKSESAADSQTDEQSSSEATDAAGEAQETAGSPADSSEASE